MICPAENETIALTDYLAFLMVFLLLSDYIILLMDQIIK